MIYDPLKINNINIRFHNVNDEITLFVLSVHYIETQFDICEATFHSPVFANKIKNSPIYYFSFHASR